MANMDNYGLHSIILCFSQHQTRKNYNSHIVYPVNTIKVLDKLNEVVDPEISLLLGGITVQAVGFMEIRKHLHLLLIRLLTIFSPLKFFALK